MQVDDFVDFQNYLVGVASMRRVDLSSMQIEIWFETLREYDLSAVKKAFTNHLRDPDNGKWMPQPSDIIRQIDGGVGDQAELAWDKAFKAVSLVGAYSDVVFDDAIIHAVVDGMGGWVKFCAGEYKDFDFKRHEFIAKYRTIRNCGMSEYVGVLQGISNAQNRMHGFRLQPPMLVGNESKALDVKRLGMAGEVLKVKNMGMVIEASVLRLVND